MKRIVTILMVLLFAAGMPLVAQNVIDVTSSNASVKEITVTNQGFDFIPKEIRVRNGDTIRLTFTNGGGNHDWVLDEFNAATQRIQTGQSETIEFTVDRVGTFEYYCNVGNHRARGMFGKFVVVE